jgi:hypothetical protein
MKKLYMTPIMKEEDVKIPVICGGDGSPEIDGGDVDTKSRHAFDDEAAIASMNGSTKMSLW